MTFEEAYAIVEKEIDGRYSINKENKKEIFDRAMTIDLPVIVEIGVHTGHTALLLTIAAALKDGIYIGMDPFTFWPDQDLPKEGYVAKLRAILHKYHHSAFIMEEDANTVRHWRSRIDFLLIDDGHDEANVEAQVLKYEPFVSEGGYIVFDDYDISLPKGHPHEGVSIVADRYITHSGKYECIVLPNMLIGRNVGIQL